MEQNQNEQMDTVFNPMNDLQIVMQNGLPVSVIVPMEEYDKMAATIEMAYEALEGKDFFLPDGTKVTFEEMVNNRVAAERAAYEEELSSMFADDCDEDCQEDCDQEEQA